MTSAGFRYSLAAIPAMALLSAPGIITGLLLDGPLAYVAVVVQFAIGLPLLVIVHRSAVRLVAQRGPEILTVVTSTGPVSSSTN